MDLCFNLFNLSFHRKTPRFDCDFVFFRYGAKCNIEDPCITRRECNSGDTACGAGCCVVDKTVILDRKHSILKYYAHECDCSMNPVYSGDECELKDFCEEAAMEKPPPPLANCNGQGTCTLSVPPTSAYCKCDETYYNDYCDRTDFCLVVKGDPVNPDPCKSDDPRNGNRCDRDATWAVYSPPDPYTIRCNCGPKFKLTPSPPPGMHDTCVEDPCYLVTCQNGGAPSASGHDCQCACAYGFHGDRCEFRDQCARNPCKNGFSCTATGNDFKCDCQPGPYLPDCEINNMCLVQPHVCDLNPSSTPPANNRCVFGGRPGVYTCNCVDGWRRDPSIQQPNCFLKEPCTDPATRCNQAGTQLCSSIPGNPQPSCDCREAEYWVGPKCEEQDICSPLLTSPYCPKGRSTCVPSPSSPTDMATCDCDPGYHGIRCEFDDRCHFNPCTNGAPCSPNQNDYSCACDPLHTTPLPLGKNCAFENGCVRDQPCRNGFPCRTNVGATPDWTCACGREYLLRPDCSERDPCVSGNQCRNGGACRRVDDTTIQCDCASVPAFLGPFCEIERTVIRVDLYPTTANVGEQVLFLLVVERVGTSPTFTLELGDSFNFEISERNLFALNAVTIQEQHGILNAEAIQRLTPLATRNWNFFPFTHIYNSVGTFRVRTTVRNGAQQLQSDQRVNPVEAISINCIPLVTLQNCGRTRAGLQDPKVPTYERRSRFVIAGSLYYEGCQPSAGIQFKWNLFRLSHVAPYPRIGKINQLTERNLNDFDWLCFLYR